MVMATSDFIPAGRTSLVKNGPVALQVQTEYAYRPQPRITTTVLNEGQVVYKIERGLKRKIDSIEGMNRMDSVIRQQHAQVLEVINDSQDSSSFLPAKQSPKQEETPTPQAQSPDSTSPPSPEKRMVEQLAGIPGVSRVFSLDCEGNFVAPGTSEEFRKSFSAIFKNLHEVLSVFTKIHGFGHKRERGVYEVENDRLFLVSAGDEFYFLYVERPAPSVCYEEVIKSTLDNMI
ncbi:MAG: hypothetical protein DRP45_08850 [Candidatus Zixiibacteriota bacterium]|nr:MAG: hypothetical protein DRP45_08850 [candidate division Zixibacteria bacterium]